MKRNYDQEFAGLELGQVGEDIITGWRGTVTGFCIYITGCAQACLTPKMDEKGESKDARWFDVTRIRIDLAVPPVELIQQPAAPARLGAPRGYGEQAPTR